MKELSLEMQAKLKEIKGWKPLLPLGLKGIVGAMGIITSSPLISRCCLPMVEPKQRQKSKGT